MTTAQGRMTEPATTEWVGVAGLAVWFGWAPRTMRRKLAALYAKGFPQPNEAIDKWYLPTCRKWAESEDSVASGNDDPLLRALDDSREH